VLLRVADGAGAERDVIVEPISSGAAANMRYDEWEYTRRLRTEALSKGQVGYVHLRAMGAGDMAQFVRDFYPVFHKPGLVIDVRDNGGGNIDSWILSRLLRKSWFFWNQRVGRSNSWNMQYAFRGHVVVLCNEHTGSDGEAFAEGIRRLNIGTVLGTRTWGGEIWLTSSNVLVDRGLASAAEFGVFGPEGTWLIEGHGVEPDVVVDNLPVETYRGEDKQLDAAVNLLIEKIAKDPRTIPPVPALPDKSFKK
jgi:tricorn protease